MTIFNDEAPSWSEVVQAEYESEYGYKHMENYYGRDYEINRREIYWNAIRFYVLSHICGVWFPHRWEHEDYGDTESGLPVFTCTRCYEMRPR